MSTPDRLARQIRTRIRKTTPRIPLPLGALLLSLGGFPLLALLAIQFQTISCRYPFFPVSFEAPDLDGRRWRSADLVGQPVVLVFWATWGGHAPDVWPLVSDAVRHHPDASFFGVLYSDEPERARRLLARDPLPCPTLLDPEGRLALDVEVGGVPEIAILDREGALVARLLPPFDEQYLDSALALARGGASP